MNVLVEAAGRDDVPAIAEILASSLKTDAFYSQLSRSHADDASGLREFFAAFAETHLGRDRELDVARIAGGQVVGVAGWTYRPEGRSSVLGREAPLSAHYLRGLGARGLVHALRLRYEIEQRRPLGTHWWLSAIAVTATARDSGVGTTLMQHRLTQIDRRVEATHLEASSATDQKFFARLGFRPHAGPGKPPCYAAQPMTREPIRSLMRND